MTLCLSLLCHVIGDYVLQSHVMALRKTTSWAWASVHAAFYSIPFMVLALASGASLRWLVALAVIGGTHAAIDRLGIARRWCQWYGVGFPGLWWRPSRCSECGHPLYAHAHMHQDEYRSAKWPEGPWVCAFTADCPAHEPKPEGFEPPPPFLGVWLIIIVDNTFHLLINTAAVLWATHAAP